MKDIKNLLENGVVTFTFKKANGEMRTATGTRVLDPEVATGYTSSDAPKGERSAFPGVIPYWDLDKQAWRSLREDSLVSIDSVK